MTNRLVFEHTNLYSRAKKLRRPYELAKFLVFWSIIAIIVLWVLYYISVALYLGFYYFVLKPPSVVSVVQPLNLRYPDPDVRDYVYAYHCVAPITYPQAYRWKLSLELPDNPSNLDAGVFMVSLALYPPNELPTQAPKEVREMFYRHLQANVGNPSIELEPTESSQMRVGSRPLMLRWRPDVYRFIHTIVYAFPRLISDLVGLGWFEETQVLETHLIERQITNFEFSSQSKQCFVVSINNPNVQIYKATIEATVLLEGWRYLLYYWFWTCLAVGSFLIFCTLVFSISSYLAFRLVVNVLRGDMKLPKLWLTEGEKGEDRLKHMRRAVSSLLVEKKRQSQSRLDLSSIRTSPRDRRPDTRPPPAPPAPSLDDSILPTGPVLEHKRSTRFASLVEEPVDPLPIGNEILPSVHFDDLDWRPLEPQSPPQRLHRFESAEDVMDADYDDNERTNRFERIDESRIASSSGALIPENTQELEEFEEDEMYSPIPVESSPIMARKNVGDKEPEIFPLI